MKHNTIYKGITLGTVLLSIVYLSSCIKDYRAGEPNFSGLQPTVLIPEGGLAAFAPQALNFPGTDASDTFYFHLDYAATDVAPVDEVVTLGVDDAALTAYNSTGGIQYQKFPDSIYSFAATSVTVKAGQSYSDRVPVTIYPEKIDPTKNYMLPISIKAAPGKATISGNFGTLYLHLIGNPVAGSYNGTGKRNNYIGSISYSYPGAYPAPASVLDLDPYFPKVVAADNANTVEIGYSNLGSAGENLVVTMDDNLVITSVTPNAALAGSVSNFVVYYANYNKATKTFHFITHYNNAVDGTGNDRIVDETLTHP